MSPTRRARWVSKYHARPKVVDGIRFDSTKEATYYGELKLREQIGEIRGLRLQRPYVVTVNGKKICTWRADFEYVDVATDAPKTVDVKGYRTPVYRLKKKLVEAIYGIRIEEV